MGQFSDWMIVGAFTFGVGIAGCLTGRVDAGLLGSRRNYSDFCITTNSIKINYP